MGTSSSFCDNCGGVLMDMSVHGRAVRTFICQDCDNVYDEETTDIGLMTDHDDTETGEQRDEEG